MSSLRGLRHKLVLTLAVLGTGVCAAVIPVALGGSGGTARNPIELENARPGTTAWDIAQSNFREVEGYTSEVTAGPGEVVHFHVRTQQGGRYRIEIYRLGWYGGDGGRLLACIPGCSSDEPGVPQPVPPFDPSTGLVSAGWPVTDTLTIPSDWVSGYYLADLVLTTKSPRVGSRVPFVVRAPDTRHARMLVQVPVNTWEAYNNWGGRSLYYPDQGGISNNHVSFDRPFDVTSFAQGSQQQWELPLVRFLERNGYDVAYQTDVDTDRDPASLLEHRLVMTAGHSEYWTRTMRDAFEHARDTGTNLAFMGANESYWQIDYGDASRRVLVEYRHADLDPNPDGQAKTTWFRKLAPPRPECRLVGQQFADRAGEWGSDATIGSTYDLSVAPSATTEPWFRATGLQPGDVLPGLVGGEWNVVATGCQPQPVTVLFQYRGTPANQNTTRYTAPAGARVFSAGSLQFTAGLDDDRFLSEFAGFENPGLETFMRNALNDLGRPAPPLSVGVSGRAVTVTRSADPRVRGVAVYRHAGGGGFSLRAPGVQLVCKTSGSTCPLRGPLRRHARYAAVAIDAWGTSLPTYSN